MATSDSLRAGPTTPERVYWACVVGILLWAILRQAGFDPDAPPIRFWPLAGVLGVAAANLLIRNRYSASRRRSDPVPSDRQGGPLGWIFVAVDFITIVAGLRFSGGLHSAVWVVSFVVLAGETVLERRREATITRFAACIAILFGTIPLPPERIDWPAYLLEMYVRMGLLIAVSSVMRRLRERSERHKTEIANLRADLALADQRAAIAREIHDGVGNSLAAAVLRLELAARTVGTDHDPSTIRDGLREEARALRSAMASVRDWTFLNHPWNAEVSSSLASVLQQEGQRWTSRTGIDLETNGLELLDALPDRFRTPILRITQEALTNVAKHAGGPKLVRIDVTKRGSRVRVEITDNGSGMEANRSGYGVGMTSMTERARGIGGELAVLPSEPTGTCVRLDLPG